MSSMVEVIHNLNNLMPGTSMVYYRGFLARDRGDNSGKGNTDIGQIANAAYSLYKSRKVFLTQKWCGDGFEYIATAKLES